MNDEHKKTDSPVTLRPHAKFPPASDRIGLADLSKVSGGGVTAQGDPIQVVPTGG